MFGKPSVCFALLVVAAVSATSHAQTILNGGTHTINGSSGPIILENGATLNVVSPASITGSSTHYGILGNAGTTINLTGGLVTGGTNTTSNIDGNGIRTFGSFVATGGSVQGGTITLGSLTVAGDAIDCLSDIDSSKIQVNGGTFQGGSSRNYGGSGALFQQYTASGPASTLSINGGTFLGGNGAINPGVGAFLSGENATSGQVSGGVFEGGAGGTPSAGGTGIEVQLVAGASLTISGGSFVGGQGGPANGLSLLYNGDGVDSPIPQLNVTGGVFSGAIGIVSVYSDLNFFGTDFAYNPATGQFTGVLQDGHMIDVIIEDLLNGLPHYSLNYQGTGPDEVTFVNVSSVPEPSSIVTLAIGLVGLAAAKRKARRGRTKKQGRS
jgi:hypothetical protein